MNLFNIFASVSVVVQNRMYTCILT